MLAFVPSEQELYYLSLSHSAGEIGPQYCLSEQDTVASTSSVWYFFPPVEARDCHFRVWPALTPRSELFLWGWQSLWEQHLMRHLLCPSLCLQRNHREKDLVCQVEPKTMQQNCKDDFSKWIKQCKKIKCVKKVTKKETLRKKREAWHNDQKCSSAWLYRLTLCIICKLTGLHIYTTDGMFHSWVTFNASMLITGAGSKYFFGNTNHKML